RYVAPEQTVLTQILNQLVSFAFITLLFALIFKYLPDRHVPWGDVWLGSALTSLLFVIGKYLLGLYLGRGSVVSAYGAAGSLVVILLWVYYASQIILFGAQLIQVYAAPRHAGDRPANTGRSSTERSSPQLDRAAEAARAKT